MKLRPLLVPLAAAALFGLLVGTSAAQAAPMTKREQSLTRQLAAARSALLHTRTVLTNTQGALAGARSRLNDTQIDLATSKAAVQSLLTQKATDASSITTLQTQAANFQVNLDAARAGEAAANAARDAAQAQADTAKAQITAGIAAQIAAMDAPTAFGLLPLIRARMSGHYDASLFTASGYQSFTFNWSSCC